jgi:hypothetical protein
MEEKKHCKWYNDEFCTNGDSPCVADYCPVVYYPELCKCREEVKDKSKEVNDLVKENTLTDEKIIKALECMSNSLSGTSGYTVDIIPYALDLIYRLQSENKRLQGYIDFKTANVMCDKCKEETVKCVTKKILDDLCDFVNSWFSVHNDSNDFIVEFRNYAQRLAERSVQTYE